MFWEFCVNEVVAGWNFTIYSPATHAAPVVKQQVG
jgi:hypothetical protein